MVMLRGRGGGSRFWRLREVSGAENAVIEGAGDSNIANGQPNVGETCDGEGHACRQKRAADIVHAALLTPYAVLMSLTVRDLEPADAEQWKALYAGYREFYKLAVDDSAVHVTWLWVLERQHAMRGIVAVNGEGELVALANLRIFARPSTGKLGLYLDDLFTSPEARGTGAGRALLERAAQIATEQSANVVRWITASDNTTARRLYDSVAVATPWVTYDLAPG